MSGSVTVCVCVQVSVLASVCVFNCGPVYTGDLSKTVLLALLLVQLPRCWGGPNRDKVLEASAGFTNVSLNQLHLLNANIFIVLGLLNPDAADLVGISC